MQQPGKGVSSADKLPSGRRAAWKGVVMQDDSNATLYTPQGDLARLTEMLGQAWGVSAGRSLIEYLSWCDRAGIFRVIAELGRATAEEVELKTPLSADGVDALLCIGAALEIIEVGEDGIYEMSILGREYFVEESPFYVGTGMYADCVDEIPDAFLAPSSRSGSGDSGRARWSLAKRIRIQHSRNFAPSVVGARSGEFDDVRHLIDVGGGTGVFSIPLVLDNPGMRVTLIDRGAALPHIRQTIESYGVQDRIELVGLDMFTAEWSSEMCDGVLFGNVLHGFDDKAALQLLDRGYAALIPTGRLWIHEVLFNERRSGPLLAALWHANMVASRPGGRQRTAREFLELYGRAGFVDCTVVGTKQGFSILRGTKR